MAIEFASASSQYIDCGSDASLDPGLGDYSVVARIKNAGSGNNEAIWGTNWAANAAVQLRKTTTDKAQFLMGDGTDAAIATGTSDIGDDTPHTLCGVWDRGTGLYIYVDGTLEGSDTTGLPTGDLDPGTNKYSIGALFGFGNSGPTLFWNGEIEDLRIFGRVLTQAEISLYAAGYRGPVGGEVLWLDMQTARGLAGWDGQVLSQATHYLPDMSSNSNDGDPFGLPTARASTMPRYGVLPVLRGYVGVTYRGTVGPFPYIIPGEGLSKASFSAKAALSIGDVFLDSVALEIAPSGPGNWVDIWEHVLARSPVTASYGIQDGGPTARVAGAGSLEFELNNQDGLWSPDRQTCYPGFRTKIPVRLKLVYNGQAYYKWRGYVFEIDPDFGRYGAKGAFVVAEDYMAQLGKYNKMHLFPLQLNVASDQVYHLILDSLDKRPTSRKIAAGLDTLPHYGHWATRQNPTAQAEINKLAASGWEKVWVVGDKTGGETFLTHNRNSTVLDRTIKAWLSDDMTDLEVLRSGHETYDRFPVKTFPTSVGTTDEVAFTLDEPIEIPAEQAHELIVRFIDPGTAKSVGLTNPVDPLVADTDFKAGSTGDGVANDMNNDLTFDPPIEWGGQGAKISLKNSSTASTLYVNKLQVRGKLIRTFNPNTFEEVANSQGDHALKQDMPYQPDPLKGRDFSKVSAQRWAEEHTKISGVEFIANRSHELMLAALEVEPGDRIGLTETQTGLNHQFIVNGIERLEYQDKLLRCRWVLFPTFDVSFLVWDQGRWDADTWGI